MAKHPSISRHNISDTRHQGISSIDNTKYRLMHGLWLKPSKWWNECLRRLHLTALQLAKHFLRFSI